LDDKLDRAVGKRLLRALVAPATGFGLGLFTGIRLDEPVEVLLVAPAAIEVVVFHLAGGEIGDYGILPAGQLHGQPFDFAAEEPGLALHRLGQPQPLAGGPDGGGIPNLGLKFDDMGQRLFLLRCAESQRLMLRTAAKPTAMPSSTAGQCEYVLEISVMSTLAVITPTTIPATPGAELELRIQISSSLTTTSSGKVARHTYRPSLLAVRA
jgi:hypothetical protein